MSYDFQSILRQALASGLGQADYTDPNGQRTKDSWIDPATGLTVMREGDGYRFVNPGEGGQNTAWDMNSSGGVGDARQYKTAGLGSMVGEFAKEGAIPLALAALGANGIGNMLGQPSMFGPGVAAGGGGGLPEVSFGQWTPTPEYGAQFVNAGDAAGLAGDATRAALYGDAGYGAGMTGAETLGFDTGLAGGTAAANGAGNGLMSSVRQFLKNNSWALPLAGGLLGASGAKQGQSNTTTRTADPRLMDAVYGTAGNGGLLSDAISQYKNNVGRLNNDQVWSGLLDQYNVGKNMLKKWGG